MAVTRLVLIRPGETDWNQEGRWQGWVQTPLNSMGKRQVSKLAKFVRNIGMSALYSSDLRRAVETAEIIADPLGFAPIYDERLRERDIGRWQGLTLEEMRLWYPDAYTQCMADPEGFVVPDGESRAQVRARVLAAFDDIIADAKGDTVGILSHTTAMKLLLTHIIQNCDERAILLGNTSVTSVIMDGGGWRLVASDDVAHLEGLESKSVGELEYLR